PVVSLRPPPRNTLFPYTTLFRSQLDTCHVGIATQIDSQEEAEEKGLKKFTPQVFELAAENCARFFTAMGEEVRQVVAEMGYERADRKSTRLNSSHLGISYAVFCL